MIPLETENPQEAKSVSPVLACATCLGWSGSILYAESTILVFSRDGSIIESSWKSCAKRVCTLTIRYDISAADDFAETNFGKMASIGRTITVENIVANGDIAHYEQSFPLQRCFIESPAADASKCVYKRKSLKEIIRRKMKVKCFGIFMKLRFDIN